MHSSFKYSMTAIRNMLNLGHMDIAIAINNGYIPVVQTSDNGNIDNYYTNSSGLAYFKGIARQRASEAMGHIVAVRS